MKEPTPARVMRQDTDVEHVRVGDEQIDSFPDAAALGLRCIAIVGMHVQGRLQCGMSIRQLGNHADLVLCEGFGREEVQRRGLGRFHKHFQNGEIITERLPTRCPGFNNDIFPLPHPFDCVCLVAV